MPRRIAVSGDRRRSGSSLRAGGRATPCSSRLFLTDGATCNYPVGTVLRVTYVEREGIKEASRVARVEW